MGFQQGDILLGGVGEGVVYRHIPLLLLAVLKQGEVGDPQQVEFCLIQQLQLFGQMFAQRA